MLDDKIKQLEVLFLSVEDVLKLKVASVAALQRINVTTIRDLLFYRPVSYSCPTIDPNLSQLREGEFIQTEIQIAEIEPALRNRPIKIWVQNDTGWLVLLYFNRIPPFIFEKLVIGSKHTIIGKVLNTQPHPQISHPEFILDKKLLREIEPTYPLTYGLTNRQLHSYILKSLELLETIIPTEILELRSLAASLHILHFDLTDKEQIEQIGQSYPQAVSNLAQYELLANQLLWQRMRAIADHRAGFSFYADKKRQKLILSNLQLKPTPAQQRVITEIEHDQSQSQQMQRLLQGDVGSGKTLVALLTMVNVVQSDHQAALMVPTDLLANQHYQLFSTAFQNTGISFALLTGSTRMPERKQILADLTSGKIKILIGTHALFQEKVEFHRLGYVVIDEQHRFGVEQRLALVNKSASADILIMTATPIPRSLALTIFGNMAISKLDTKPRNRLPVITSICPMNKMNKIIEALDKKLSAGEKIYWVCPMINQDELEVSNNVPMSDVESRYQYLQSLYGERVAKLHSKMTAKQKDDIMQKFSIGNEVSILVATTVIEVGIDVPEANLMIIENAEQFGLAQLHQLRGRVGRGNKQSYCIMLYNPKRLSEIAHKRLEIIRKSNDGFYIAEQDLFLRGSGEVLGIKQSGEQEFFFAKLPEDTEILNKAHEMAQQPLEFADFYIKLFARNTPNQLN